MEIDKYKLGDEEELSQIKNLINCIDKECSEKEEKKKEINSKEKIVIN